MAAAASASVPENLSREQYLYLAKLAEQAERYEEMVQFMDKLVLLSTPHSELTVEERNLLSVAYKNVIGSLRAAWRIVSSIEQKEESRKNEEHVALVKEYRNKVENELSDVCGGILKLLESNLVPSGSLSESKVFYLKMKGDYFRYLAEFKIREDRKQAAEDTLNSYKAAQEIALADLSPTHPIRLGLALNFSVFYFEILNSADRACSMAKQRKMDNENQWRGSVMRNLKTVHKKSSKVDSRHSPSFGLERLGRWLPRRLEDHALECRGWRDT